MLTFHQDETCEGIIRHLEIRAGAVRHDVRVRDKGNHTSADARVEMTFRLRDQLFAIEHTGIEPFDGFMEHQNRAPVLFKPLEAAITAALGPVLRSGVVIEMHMPIDAFNGCKLPEVRAIQAALVEWARVAAPTLPARKYGDYHNALLTEQPHGVPFSVSLVRFDGMVPGLAGYFQLKHQTRAADGPRPRIQRACDTKFPKLHIWKRSDNAHTILVLEDNDVQLTNVSIVANAFLPIAEARADRPDETYMVATCASPWYASPLLIDGQTYFDLANVGPVHFEMDPTGQLVASA
jgi:hypothetical protein